MNAEWRLQHLWPSILPTVGMMNLHYYITEGHYYNLVVGILDFVVTGWVVYENQKATP